MEKKPNQEILEGDTDPNPEIKLSEIRELMIELIQDLSPETYPLVEEVIHDKVAPYLESLPRPEDVNFDLEIENKDGDCDIVLRQRDGGKEFRISSLVQGKAQLVPSEGFAFNMGYRDEPNIIKFAEASSDRLIFLFQLLHEVGHLDDYNKGNYSTKATWEDKKMIFATILEMLLEGKNPGSEEALQRFRERQYSSDKGVSKYVSGERNAHAYAIRKLRELDKEGFDVFSGLDRKQDILTFVLAALSTYELGRYASRARRNTGPTKDRKAKFVRQSKF